MLGVRVESVGLVGSGRAGRPGTVVCGVVLLALATPAFAQPAVTLTADPPAPRPVGTSIVFTATASDTSSGTFDFRFSVRPSGGTFRVVKDFSFKNTLQWVPTDHEGDFDILVVARNRSTAGIGRTMLTYRVTSLVPDAIPVITPTPSPLVVLYSAPPCPVGSSIQVLFLRAGAHPSSTTSTPLTQCVSGLSMNFYLAGMRPDSAYNIRHKITTGSQSTYGPILSYTTGPLPILLPAVIITSPVNVSTDISEDLLLYSFIKTSGGIAFPAATDLNGNTVWYYPGAALPGAGQTILLRSLQGGNMLVLVSSSILREIDLAGNTVRETNILRIGEQLNSRGATDPCPGFHHDAIRLPNGHTVAFAFAERMWPAGTQGSTAPVDVLGTYIIDLDENFQVVWFWNAFDHLDINRAATLGDVCWASMGALCPLTLAPIANDWLHSNSIDYIPADGNLLVSVRNQDWVVKIDYSNGAGTGSVLWKLGLGGDFTISSSDPYPWFSHQHDAAFEVGGTQILSLFDNGNTRRWLLGATSNSRGQVLSIDEAGKSASLLLNVDLGGYLHGLGSAQRLSNGNYHFLSGWENPTATSAISRSMELLPDGTTSYVQQVGTNTYRSFRMGDLYTP